MTFHNQINNKYSNENKYLRKMQQEEEESSQLNALSPSGNLRKLFKDLKILLALFSVFNHKKLFNEKFHLVLKKIFVLYHKMDGSADHKKRKKREIDEQWAKKAIEAEENIKKDQLEFELSIKNTKEYGAYQHYIAKKVYEMIEPDVKKAFTNYVLLFSPAFTLFKQASKLMKPRPQPKSSLSPNSRFTRFSSV